MTKECTYCACSTANECRKCRHNVREMPIAPPSPYGRGMGNIDAIRATQIDYEGATGDE